MRSLLEIIIGMIVDGKGQAEICDILEDDGWDIYFEVLPVFDGLKDFIIWEE